MTMTITLTRRALAAVLITLATAAVTWAEPIPGKIDEATKTSVTVNGQRYTIETETTIEDRSGAPVSVTELRPGTDVEIELDGRHLVNLRAAVVR